MKIDEKVLAYFESCNSPVDKEGYLYKKVRHFWVKITRTRLYVFTFWHILILCWKRNRNKSNVMGIFFFFLKKPHEGQMTFNLPLGCLFPQSSCVRNWVQKAFVQQSVKHRWHNCHTGWNQNFLSEALVRAEGEPPLLQGTADRPGSDRSDCSGGLHRPAVRVRGEFRLLAGVEWAGAADVQVRGGGPGRSGELDQSPAVSQPQLPGPACNRNGVEVQRWEKKGSGGFISGGGKRAGFVLEGSCEKRCITVYSLYIRHLVHCGTG